MNPDDQNKVNNFSQNTNVADKHLDYVANAQKTDAAPQTMNQYIHSLDQSGNQIPTSTTQYINPNNFKEVLHIQDPPITTQENINNTKQVQPQASTPTPLQQANPTQIIAPSLKDAYKDLKINTEINNKRTKSEHDIIKLCLYLIPGIAILFLLIHPINNDDVKWHTKQSLVVQGIWYAVVLILYFLNAYIISSLGLDIWNILCYGLLVIAGVQAYIGNKFHIPVAYELGKSFIEGEAS